MTTSPLFKRVPAEPTREMCEAMPVLPALTQDDLRFKALGWPMHAIQNRHRLIAALAASPEPPAAEVETLRERVKELEAGIEALQQVWLSGAKIDGEKLNMECASLFILLDRARAKGDG